MTFGEYVGILFSTGLFGTNIIQAGASLFKAAGPKKAPKDQTVRSWIEGKRQFSTVRYFSEGQVDENGFIIYFRRRAKDSASWGKIQDAFQQWRTKNLEDKSFRVDTKTDDRDELFWSLLNQFQKIFGLPETERKIIKMPIEELSPQKIRKEFLDAVNRYNVMKIIRRKPAVLNWEDSANIDLFLLQMEQMNLNCVPYNDALCASIKGFIMYLRDQAMSLKPYSQWQRIVV